MSHGDPPPLPAAKLAPPQLRTPSLRADQLERVAAVAGARLVVVRAPAGYGKTTLIATAAVELGWRHVWYRLDPLDADPDLFFGALGRAVGERLPETAGVIAEPAEIARPAAEAAARLAAGLGRAAAGDELFLVLDDYETLVDEDAFNQALAALLSYAPAAVHFVLLTRVRPSLPTGKLALEGGLAEIGHEQLRFHHVQVAEALERDAAAPPSPVAVETLLDRTDGWPAGVRFAAAAGRRLEQAALEEALADGELERAVFPYLAEQVHARLDASAQDFLRRTCCLETTTAALAEEVSGIPDAGSLLARLEAEGAFTFGEPSRRYRYHPLLRAFVREQLVAAGGQAALRALQRRSASALASSDHPTAAVELYLDAGDVRATVRVLEQRGSRLLEECSDTLLSRWVAALNTDAELSGWARLVEGRQLFLAGDLVAARRRLEAALALLTDEACGRYLALRTLSKVCSVAGKEEDSVVYAKQAVQVAEGGDRAPALSELALALAQSCRWPEFERVQTEFGDLAAAPSDLAAEMMLIGVHAAYAGGDVGVALMKAEKALPAVRRSASSVTLGTLLTGLAGFALFSCRYEKGARYVEEARRVCRAAGPLYARAQADVVAAMFLAQQGDLRDCLAMLDDVVADPLMETNGGILRLAHLMRGTALRRVDELTQAMQSCRPAVASLSPATSVYDRLDAQIDLAVLEGIVGAPRHAIARLRALRPDAEASGLRFQAGKAGFFAGVLSFRAGEDGSEALGRSVAELLTLGQLDFLGQELVANPEAAAWLPAGELSDEQLRELLRACALQVGGPQLVASLADRGERMLALLTSLARTDLPEPQAASLLRALRRHPAKEVRDRARRLDLGTSLATTRLFLELTSREEEILALLADGCSNAQIARRLVLSVGTVKTHVHRIFTKTGVHSRLAAAMLYRQRVEATVAPH